MRPEMPAGSLEPMRPDPCVKGARPSVVAHFQCAPSRSTPAFGSGHLDLQISRPALRPHVLRLSLPARWCSELVAGGWMAADYPTDKIRNVVLLGHSHDGKTTLAEAMLFASGAVPRQGSTDQQTATMDFEPEEQRRKISINLGVGFAEHGGFKINILDAPGFFDFTGQVLSGLRAAEGAVVVVGASGQLAVGTEIAWEHCNRTSKPRIVVVNKLDKEHSDFYGAVG